MQNTATKLRHFGNYQKLRDYLLMQTRWVTQDEINQETGLSGVAVRRVCSQYPCLALGSTEGYKMVAFASRHEIQHAVSTLLSRSLKITKRAQLLSQMISY